MDWRRVITHKVEAELRAYLGTRFDELHPRLRRLCRGYYVEFQSRGDDEAVRAFIHASKPFIRASTRFLRAWDQLPPSRRDTIWVLAGGQPVRSRSIHEATKVLRIIVQHQEPTPSAQGRPPEILRRAFLDTLADYVGDAGVPLLASRVGAFYGTARVLWAVITGLDRVPDIYRDVLRAVNAYYDRHPDRAQKRSRRRKQKTTAKAKRPRRKL